ncbi:unnamed protein product [Arabidopsis thaliana]|uniref:Transferring glycosyl group transferase n=1 Tax=Arabidopsis thaliana TaxID=3702 RepID=Q9LK42_ARATH|nr:unnamed protein product [Arabidopsis thaliana]
MVLKPIHSFIVILLLVLSVGDKISAGTEPEKEPVPAVWPEQFHALMLMNKSGSLEIVDLWYDWVNGRNFNIIQKQLGKLTYDLEWNNGTSFYYTLDASKTCRTVHFEMDVFVSMWECSINIRFHGIVFSDTLTDSSICLGKVVGILRPNWLDGAKYMGQRHVNGFLCNVWEKVEFLWYYEDVVTKRPVQWIFYTGREAHVMTFEVGAVLEDEKWQAPVYCFHNEKKEVQ